MQIACVKILNVSANVQLVHVKKRKNSKQEFPFSQVSHGWNENHIEWKVMTSQQTLMLMVKAFNSHQHIEKPQESAHLVGGYPEPTMREDPLQKSSKPWKHAINDQEFVKYPKKTFIDWWASKVK